MILAVAAIASCKKPDPEPGPGPGPSNDPVLKATLPSAGPLSVYRWSASDEIRVGDKVFALKEGAGTTTATFNGTPDKDSYYTIAYPSDIRGTDSYMSYSLLGQTQEGNTVDHIIWTALIEDASTWEDITFSKEWATSKGASFRSNGVVAFNLILPSDIGTLKSITLESSGVKFPVNNSGDNTATELVLGLNGVSASSAVKAYLAVSEKEVDIPAGTLKITVEGDVTYNILLSEAVKMGGGILTEINVSDASAWKAYFDLKGAGTEASPYILSAPEHLEQMPQLLVEGKTVWFELGDDINMENIADWEALNTIPPYDKAVNFDGKGHTIRNFKCETAIYPSFFGVLNGTVKNVVFDNAEIDGGGKAGVVAGYCGTNVGSNDAPVYLVGNLTNVTVKNSTVKTDSYAGGLIGQIYSPAKITDCHAIDVTVSSTGERVGGVIGQMGVSNFDVGASVKNCTAENVTCEAQKNVGALIGVAYGIVTGCTASGRVTSNLAYNKEVSVGGLIGHIENSTVKECSASTVVELTQQGRSIGGFVGTFKSGLIEKCYATGEIIGTYRNNGGFVGLIQTNTASSASATIRNCYATGDVNSNAHMGGFLGLVDAQPGQVIIEDCYSSGNVVGTGFGVGGFMGYEGCTAFQIKHCAAWGKTVTAGDIAADSWSSGAFCAITLPSCSITDCYRHPEMALTAWWVPDAGYQHPNVSSTSWLIVKSKTTGDLITSPVGTLANGEGTNYPQFAYHGKVESGKTLSQLASTTLGWDASIWDFSGDVPVFKK